MGKFSKSVSFGYPKVQQVAVPEPMFIPLEELDSWQPLVASGQLPVSEQIQMYWNIGLHAGVVEKLCRLVCDDGRVHQDDMRRLLQGFYKETREELKASIERNLPAAKGS